MTQTPSVAAAACAERNAAQDAREAKWLRRITPWERRLSVISQLVFVGLVLWLVESHAMQFLIISVNIGGIGILNRLTDIRDRLAQYGGKG